MSVMVENINSQLITPAVGSNPRVLYEHQIKAEKEIDRMNKNPEFRTLLVLPTGGGKTLTAVHWLLKNAVDKGKKILWIAHRRLLLEQAAETFWKNAYTGAMINHTSFNYRIVSGIHDKPINIKNDDSVLIVGKDSIIRSLDKLEKWLKNEEIFLVIDEAHHAVAKSYKRIISFVDKKAKSVKLLGLTATPFRTSQNEQGALKQIFTDDICYKVDLNTLINKGILAHPIFEECETNIDLSEKLAVNALKSIENFDKIPDELAKEIAENTERNNKIVNEYMKNYEKYGPTIVFALNQDHAISLNKLFNEKGKKYGIKSDFIISSVRDAVTGITISDKENEEKIERYRNGEIQVLINVNILTEGTDLPKTHTVFLARPTVSTVLMTQMVGRALRGTIAGGTKDAYIVSFIDDWNNKIAWVNPKTLDDSEYIENDTETSYRPKVLQLISIALIEELAMIADMSVDTSLIERFPMIQRIPIGMYSITFIDSGIERSHQILIYNSSEAAYSGFISDLNNIMESFGIEDEEIPDDVLDEMISYCMENYFEENIIPAIIPEDIACMLKFYAQKEVDPLFIALDYIDRKKLDVSEIALKIQEMDSRREQKEYIDSLWNGEDSVYRIYYSKKYFFKKLIDIELDKLDGYIEEAKAMPQSDAEKRELEKFPLQMIIEMYPEYGIELKENIFAAAKGEDGLYFCKSCGQRFRTRERLQIDHIKPMSKGGLTVPENLQVLCRTCNLRKSDKE